MIRTKGAKYPLLQHLTLVQMISFALLIGIVAADVIYITLTHRVSYENKLVQAVKPKLLEEQERWRSFASLSMNDSLDQELKQTMAELPNVKIFVMERSTAMAHVPPYAIIVPEVDDGNSSYVVVAKIDSAMFQSLVPEGPYAVVLLITIAAFFGVAVYSNRFIKAKIYEPIWRLNKVLADAEHERRVAIVDIEATGEMREFINRIIAIYEKSRQAEAASAIASTTQMLAHDVRKPFSILRMGLDMLADAADPESVRNTLSVLIPEVDRAVKNVNGLIADVMEVGSTSVRSTTERVSPESLISTALYDVFAASRNADISIHYDFRHRHGILVQPLKIGRVFSNILVNAVQATGQKGEIWFSTVEKDGFMVFSIGNSGSHISEKDIPHIFDAFFTAGKTGGTGLGLAIADKLIAAHGGKIWCKSVAPSADSNGHVEFYFTLPVARDFIVDRSDALPRHSSELSKVVKTSPVGLATIFVDRSNMELEDALCQRSLELGRPLRVLVIDDEAVYRSALIGFLTRTAKIRASMSVFQAENSDQAMEIAKSEALDLIITDIDLGVWSLNGFDLIRQIRSLPNVDALICVHSNRIVGADHKTATDAGADAFLPKPMAHGQILRLAMQSVQRVKPLHDVGANDEEKPTGGASIIHLPRRPAVLVVDDSLLILDAWERKLRHDADYYAAENLEEVERLFHDDPDLIGRLAMVVTDLNFDNSMHNGLDICRKLKSIRTNLPIFLSSESILDPEETEGIADCVIDKIPVNFAKLFEKYWQPRWPNPFEV